MKITCEQKENQWSFYMKKNSEDSYFYNSDSGHKKGLCFTAQGHLLTSLRMFALCGGKKTKYPKNTFSIGKHFFNPYPLF